mgnify:CR=1 FL=1
MSTLSVILDLLVPPRASERLVRSLKLDELFVLAHRDRGALPYHDPRVTALVWEVKYRANKRALSLAGQFLAEQLLAIAAEELGAPLLVPVPMHEKRKKTRGHNQTELLCRALMAELQEPVEYLPLALKRIKETSPQQGLERQKRLKNVVGSMQAIPSLVEGRACIVVDDVTTTGATLEEAARALKEAGARRVHFLTLAES